MVQAISSQAGDPSFGEAVLARRSKGSAFLQESKPINPIAKLPSVDLVIVANQKTARELEWTGFDYLVGRPLHGP
jgi:hypothetical protein